MSSSINTEKILEEALIKNLVKNKKNIIDTTENIDVLDTTNSIKKLFELKLLEMELVLDAKKQEEIWIRKREVRQAQLDRMEEARKTIALLSIATPTAIILSILEDCYKILANITEVGKEEFSHQQDEDKEDKEELIHLTSRDIKHSLSSTNIVDVMRTAKKNGWDLRIVNGKLFVYRNGKKISGKENIFIPCEEIKENKKSQKNKKIEKLRKLLE